MPPSYVILANQKPYIVYCVATATYNFEDGYARSLLRLQTILIGKKLSYTPFQLNMKRRKHYESNTAKTNKVSSCRDGYDRFIVLYCRGNRSSVQYCHLA